MAVPKQVSKKLQQTMGDDAGSLMTEWLDELQETSRGTRAALDGIEAQLTALRDEMRAGFARIDVRFEQVEARFAQVDTKFAQSDAKTERSIAATQRWAITVWLASLGFAIAVMMGYMTWLVRGAR